MRRLWVVLGLILISLPGLALQGRQSKVEIAYEGEGYSYREPHMDLPISLKGQHHGASIKYTQTGIGGASYSFGEVEGRFLTGKTDYDGYLMNGTPSTADDITNWYIELRGLYGLQFGNTVRFAPYLGVAYRFLSNNMDEDAYGYRRESTYYYMPIGFYLSTGAENGFSVTLNGEFDWLIYGNQYSGIGYGLNHTQDKGIGLRGGIKVEQNFGAIGLFIEPFYRFWKIQNSDVVSGYIEPFNISREYGTKIGLTF